MPWGAIAGSLIGGFLGNKREKKARRRAIEDQRQQFSRIRESAEKAGFNPLTAVGSPAAGGFGGLPSGTLPPLASVELAQNAILGVRDVVTGKAASDRRRQEVMDRLRELDLERLEAGQSGAIAALTKAAQARPVKPRIGAGSSPGWPSTRASAGKSLSDEAGARAEIFDPRREVEVKPISDGPGVMQITAPWLGGSVNVPTLDGDEALGLGEAIANAPVILPQLAYNWGKRGVEAVNSWSLDSPGVAYPSISPHALHQNPADIEAIRRNRYGKE